jgi:hypothetical protein
MPAAGVQAAGLRRKRLLNRRCLPMNTAAVS